MHPWLGLDEDDRAAIFIDGANLYKTARNLGFDIDYKSLLKKTREESRLIRAYYYTSMQEDRDQDYSPLRPLVDWLDYNGYTMVTKIAREYTDAQGKKRYKGSVDIELAVDMVMLADKLDAIVLFTGNGDFRRAIEAVQGKGVKVTLVSTVKTTPPMASDDIRRMADHFIDLADLQGVIGRKGAPPRKTNEEEFFAEEDEF
ncbi:NYN domain-containing protein [Aquisalinus flavus]|uniref:NYN domain-containing protein n=1 Tax=Aquisalinus flavus TaxID=1526572 RepID=A0A8J2V180_9PROT|nr:NYN domain-containing protein [Aquisalinus flavus]MBD0427664.1 NYN domain-containing protein [Aquisalinus flavus]UNE47448.1 NYN domain-containing protein [Aquisalinus flavus]GGD02843.1 NYN domain-containing protein [Aquisalinus flavus]